MDLAALMGRCARTGVHFSPESVYWTGQTLSGFVTAKDTQTFVGEIYRAHNQRLLGFLANRLRHANLHAADLAQEVYLRLSRIRQPQTIREPQAYLFRVARNVIHDHEIGLVGAAQTADLIDQAEAAETAVDPAAQLEQRQRVELINRWLEELPPRARAIFTLHRAYGHTVDEMAAEFGLSRSQVKKDFAKALAYLNERLRQDR